MTGKSNNAQNPKFTFYCPITKKPLTSAPREQLLIPDGKTNWWHCPECNGWHVAIAQDEIDPRAINQFCYKPAS